MHTRLFTWKRKYMSILAIKSSWQKIKKKSTLITVRKTGRSILQRCYDRPKTVDQTSEKLNIITTAAKLIKPDILSLRLTSNLYPLSSDIESLEKNLQYIPESLQTLLKIFIREKDQGWRLHRLDRQLRYADGEAKFTWCTTTNRSRSAAPSTFFIKVS